MIRYGSVCSGVEAATLAWKPLGWECVFVSEVEPFPCAVLQHRLGASRPIHPLDPAEAVDDADAAERRSWMKQNEKLREDGVIPNEGDFTKIGDKYRGKIDLLVGGTPCFPAGNLVLTEFGYVPIENIHVGDFVVSHKGRLCRVLKTGSKVANNVGECYVDGMPLFRVTANHPYLVGCQKSLSIKNTEFKPLHSCIGNYAAVYRPDAPGQYFGAKIEGFILLNQSETVYNLEVKNDNSYICNGLCVHNCQDLSVAGQRAGFEGERSVLAIDFVRLAYQSGCRWFCWENVPGVFSSNGGGDFARLLSLFTGCDVGVPEQGFGSAGFVCNARRDRFGVAWRVLDAQFTRVPGCFPFAIPQRRRRVFVVGYLGDWRRAAEVLLEPGSVSWTTPARRKTRKAVAASFGSSIKTPGGVLNGSHWDDFLANPHPTLCAYKTGIGASNQEVFVQRGAMLVPVPDSVYTVRMRSGCDGGEKGALVGTEMSHTLATSNDQTVIYTIDADRSNAMKSSNPNSGIHEADVAKTLDTTVPTPQKAQGGQMVVQFAAGFVGRQGAEAGSIGYEAEVCPTIRYSMNPDVVISLAAGQGGEWGCLGVDVAQTLSLNNGGFHYIACYENHANDSRVTFSGSVSPSLTSRAGTGGGNLPLVMSSTDLCFDVGNGQVDCSMHPLYECATTLHCMHDANAVMCVPINSMIIGKDVTLTDRQTTGIGEDGDALPTLQANHHHAVAVVASFMGGQGSVAGGISYRRELSPTIKASPSGGNTVPDVMVAACAIAENVIGRQIHNGGNGVGAKLEVAYTIDTVGVQGVAVDVVDKQGMALRDVVPTLTATSFKEAPAISIYANVSISEELENVDAKKTHPSEILRILREIIGEKAFSEWFRRHACVSEEEILQQNVHGSSVRCEAVSFNKTQHMPLSCEKNCLAWKMRNLWQGECIGRSSQGQGFQKQCSVESSSNLSKLSQQDSSSEKDVCDMWQTSKGAWLLHEALGEIQKIRKSIAIQAKPIRYNTFGFVRRLLPIETERLMGFPDNHTRIPWNGRSELDCPDGPRYKACGNSFCVNVVRWIGEQIQRVDNMEDADDATAEK